VKKELATSETLLCPPKVTFRLLGSVLGNASFRGVSIRVGALSGILTAMERRCLETDAARQLAPFVTVPVSHPMVEQLAQLFVNDGAIALSNRLGIVQSFAEFLAPQLREAGMRETFTKSGAHDAKSRMIQLINQMPESELATISLSRFAQKIHSCERHASRLFQEVWGSSFRSFVSDLRLKKACQLLLEDKLKIIDVALESGHGSLAHFNYVFKKQLRLTPTEWRQRHLKGAANSNGASEKLEKVHFKAMAGIRSGTSARSMAALQERKPLPQSLKASSPRLQVRAAPLVAA
jgi:AraC-like DNA-binding protein